MPSRGQAITVTYLAWNNATNTGQAADSLNHVVVWIKDGVSAGADGLPSEVDPTNAAGVYSVLLTAAETTAWVGEIAGRSTTPDVVIIPKSFAFEQLPIAAPDAAGGIPVSDAGALDVDAIAADVAGLGGAAMRGSDTAPDNATIAAILVKLNNATDGLAALLASVATRMTTADGDALATSVAAVSAIVTNIEDGTIKKNTAGSTIVRMRDAAGVPVAAGTAVTGRRALDTGAYGAMTATIAATGPDGESHVAWTAADVNGVGTVSMLFSATGALDVELTLQLT